MSASIATADRAADLRTGSRNCDAARDRPWVTAAVAFVLVSTVAHLWLALHFPLAPDETYYWEWSRHLGLGYYDQGPMIAWWIRASRMLFGDTLLGVRFGIVAATLALQVFVWLLARDLFGPRTALWSLVLSAVTVLAIAGSFIATYDPLVVLFWAAGAWFASRAVLFQRRGAWLGLGIALGLGLLSKHTMVLLVPCLVLAFAPTPEGRTWLRGREPWLALGVAAAVFAPNVWWQTQHGWMTFRHLFLLAGGGSSQPVLRRFGDYVGSQAGVVTPVLFSYLLAALWWSAADWRAVRAVQAAPAPGRDRLWFLFSLSAPVLLFFLTMSLRTKVQANWAICGWLTPPILLAARFTREREAHASDDRAVAGGQSRTAWRGLTAVITTALFVSLMVCWPEARVAIRVPVPSRWDQMNTLYGGAELGAAADRVRASMAAEGVGPVAVGADTYDIASRLAFYMSGQPQSCCLFAGTRINSYVLWNSSALPRPGGAMVLADDYAIDDPRLAPFRELFDRVEMERQPVEVYRPSVYREPVHRYYLYRCYGYRPNPTVETPHGG